MNNRRNFSNENPGKPQNPLAMSMDDSQQSHAPRVAAPVTTKKPAPTGASWQPSEDQIERDGRSVCVKNLDPRIDEDMLLKLFRTAGNVLNITLNRNKAGVSKGYAYIEFSSKDAQTNAINLLNGQDILSNGKNIVVVQKRVNQPGFAKKKRNNQQAILAKAITQLARIVAPRGRGGRGRGGFNQRGGRGGFTSNNPMQEGGMGQNQGMQGGFPGFGAPGF